MARKTPRNLYLSDDIYKAIQELGAKEERSASYLYEKAAVQFLAEHGVTIDRQPEQATA